MAKLAFVTGAGAAGGIGFACARALGALGCRLAIAATTARIHDRQAELQALLDALPGLPSPVLFVSNEVGWGVSPMSREARFYVDELGRLNQAVARCCQDLTLMVAGQAWTRPVENIE